METDLEKKKAILEKEYGIPMTKTFEKEVKRMAGLSAYFIEQGYSQGISQGITEGILQGIAQGITEGISQGIAQGKMEERARSVHYLMVKQNFTFEAAAEFLEIDQENQAVCLEKMKKLGYLQ